MRQRVTAGAETPVSASAVPQPCKTRKVSVASRGGGQQRHQDIDVTVVALGGFGGGGVVWIMGGVCVVFFF